MEIKIDISKKKLFHERIARYAGVYLSFQESKPPPPKDTTEKLAYLFINTRGFLSILYLNILIALVKKFGDPKELKDIWR